MVAVRLSNHLAGWRRETGKPRANVSLRSSKIFPPTPEDLPGKEEEPAEAEAATAKPSTGEAASAVSNDATDESHTKKLKTSTGDLGKDDWEAVEKPNETTSDEAGDIGEEGEKVEAAGLGGSEGEKVEKPVGKQGGESKAGAVQPENMLAKDW